MVMMARPVKKKDVVQLKYCPRTKHSEDMPLKKTTRACFNRAKDGRCGFMPCVSRYCDANGIDVELSMVFVCANPNVVVGRKPKRATLELDFGYKFRLECPVFDDGLLCCRDRLAAECVAMHLRGNCPELKILNVKGQDMSYNAKTLLFDMQTGGLVKQWPSKRGE